MYRCYENGWGVVADFGKALELYQKAAEGGYYRALYNMGVCHENGEGVPQDSAKVPTLHILLHLII
jgi:TPR repeat protein